MKRGKHIFCNYVSFAAVLAMIWISAGCGEAKAETAETVSIIDTVNDEEEKDMNNDNQEASEQETSIETYEETAITEETIEATEMEEVNRHWINEADISWIDPEKPMVALSFDDGPVSPVSDKSTAIRIQNALADNGMHATFFYWGNTLTNHTKKELERAYELGFELGNHTLSHPDLAKLTKEEIEEQIAKIDAELTAITGREQFLVRPPYLSFNQTVKDTINVPLISCAIDTKDWDNATTEQIIDVIVKAAEDGSLDGKIVLMHETYVTTAEAMEYVIPYLKEKGYQVVTISELFKVRGKEMEAGKVYIQCNK